MAFLRSVGQLPWALGVLFSDTVTCLRWPLGQVFQDRIFESLGFKFAKEKAFG